MAEEDRIGVGKVFLYRDMFVLIIQDIHQDIQDVHQDIHQDKGTELSDLTGYRYLGVRYDPFRKQIGKNTNSGETDTFLFTAEGLRCGHYLKDIVPIEVTMAEVCAKFNTYVKIVEENSK